MDPQVTRTVHIDRDRDIGEYWEPRLWLIHQAGGGTRAEDDRILEGGEQ